MVFLAVFLNLQIILKSISYHRGLSIIFFFLIKKVTIFSKKKSEIHYLNSSYSKFGSVILVLKDGNFGGRGLFCPNFEFEENIKKD